MADISGDVYTILNAPRGEDVRDAIVDACNKIFNEMFPPEPEE